MLLVLLVPLLVPIKLPIWKLPGYTLHSDFALHTLLFACLTCIILCPDRHSITFFGLSAVGFAGVVSEVIQLWIPHRTFSLLDLSANLAGILIGTIIYLLVWKEQEDTRKSSTVIRQKEE